MRNLLVALVLFTTGCAGVVAYDSIQYDKLAEIMTYSTTMVASCDQTTKIKADLPVLQYKITNYEISTRYRGDTVYHDAGLVLTKMTSDMVKAYDDGKTPSKAYCELKIDGIKTAAEHTLITMGRK